MATGISPLSQGGSLGHPLREGKEERRGEEEREEEGRREGGWEEWEGDTLAHHLIYYNVHDLHQ